MEDKVIKFIKYFQNEGTIKVFTEGCCYWFAKILSDRFLGLMMYNPIDNHFATIINTKLYDITGEIPWTKDWYEWNKYKELDSLETERIYKYCIDKTCS